MRTFSVSFFLGTLILLIMPVLPDVQTLAGAATGWLLLLIFGWFFQDYWLRSRWLSVLVGGVGAGCLYALLAAVQMQASWLPETLEGEDLLVSGVVADVPEPVEGGVRFLLDADSEVYQGRLRLAWYTDDVPAIRAGERWQLRVRGKRPRGFANPGGFDYAQWLFAQRIGGNGYVRPSVENQLLADAPWWSANNLRQHLKDRISLALTDSAMTGLVQGLAIAYTENIGQAQWDVLRKTGTIHLLAISGLHITMVAGLGIIPVWLVWRLFPGLYLRLPLRIAAGLAGGVLAIGYGLLAGMNIPTQRTLLMLLVMLAGLVWRRSVPFSVVFCLALLLVLLLDPFASLSVGFWLSFLTVGLLVFLAGRQRRVGKGAFVWMQLLLSLGTVPLVAGFFGMVSLSSPLANLLAIPLVTFVVTPLVLLGIVFAGWWDTLAAGLWQAAAWLLEWLMWVLAWLAELPLSAIYLPTLPLVWLVLAGLGFLLLWSPRGLPGRWLGMLLMLPLALYQPDRPQAGSFRLSVLDVGQGLSSVVQTQNHVLVFDAGPKVSDSFDTGMLVLLPWLHGQGISHVDRLVVSHADNDHSGGAEALLADMPVEQVMVGSTDMLPAYQPLLCQRGQQWSWDGVEFTVLHPDETFREPKDNNRSCVLRVGNAHHSVLLTADIERVAESFLLRQQENLASEVLLVPHHGSKTSSSAAFLNRVDPSLGIVTSGYRNRFNHPHPEVVERYAQRHIKLLGTVDSGELRLDFPATEAGLRIREWRQAKKHFW
ncbi:MAG TPA: DNA internalization-related competence protein ComEC/Rec2 [Candidatus Thiothrix moscowensis]|uniref:DNA internalization-related competence protein ComEC/Rec2 n=1 Tax=unclassified Thiothrix TaxID=2636184 RepID=UPI0025D2C4CE|nr:MULTISPECIES: DNA internalization-related competence protein ComEC/Rec2 [unclassified Thiothrix]HRJ53650.1 DNA internalization-related competence protein ComEC/Rec2 [Candidatus Thiothrix moscowensis]HRJ93732.1 DNA internalization-related competence protein ComEC/Rec2 [Candidatus Thiothrix moscowensis]